MIAALASHIHHALSKRRIAKHWPSDAQWQRLRAHYPVLPAHPRLRELTALLLHHKEFSTVEPLVFRDDMALAIAAQAALVLLGMSLRDEAVSPSRAYQVVKLYEGSKGIVLHPAGMLASRKTTDGAGVEHHWREAISGEAMEGGPLTLSWQDVAETPRLSAQGHNLVIHEFAHVLDMKNGNANGVPLLPAGFWATGMGGSGLNSNAKSAYGHWQRTMQSEYDAFCERLSMAERFGADMPWLDAYAATAPEEFFAVTAEAYFSNPKALATECPSLIDLYDAYFQAWRWR